MPGEGRRGARQRPSAILTLPNLISLLRIVSIPLFVWLIVDRDTTFVGLVVFGTVVATDWVDGVLARATRSVSELGKVLDPAADRLCIAAGLIALTARGAFPLAAALPILVRDAAILGGGGVLLFARRARIEVRPIGKVATFALMSATCCIAWGSLGYPFPAAFLAMGWVIYAVGIVEYAAASVRYVGDLRRVLTATGETTGC
jgi:cardiolipin synthase